MLVKQETQIIFIVAYVSKLYNKDIRPYLS